MRACASMMEWVCWYLDERLKHPHSLVHSPTQEPRPGGMGQRKRGCREVNNKK